MVSIKSQLIRLQHKPISRIRPGVLVSRDERLILTTDPTLKCQVFGIFLDSGELITTHDYSVLELHANQEITLVQEA